ncbi:MAG TPA: hypothetical protein VI461_18505 [Chitinophagaceae bacterium]|nr:hypothetical protein [Chitinophagaceae bacterium]
MKAKHFIWAAIIIIILQSCARAMTPYEAANHPRGKHCREIR